MNPYEAPANPQWSKQGQVPAEEVIVSKPFRWRVIPASLSWLIGGFYLLILPFALHNNWRQLTIDFRQDLPWILVDISMLAVFPLILGLGIAFLFAGGRWMSGRWISAIALNVVPVLLWLGVSEVEDYLLAWAKSLP